MPVSTKYDGDKLCFSNIFIHTFRILADVWDHRSIKTGPRFGRLRHANFEVTHDFEHLKDELRIIWATLTHVRCSGRDTASLTIIITAGFKVQTMCKLTVIMVTATAPIAEDCTNATRRVASIPTLSLLLSY